MTPSGDDKATTLSQFQQEVSRAFFELDASRGFLLAGGAALIAQQLVARHTQDLDLFTHEGAGTVSEALGAFEDMARQRGWKIERLRESDTFARLQVTGEESLLIDLALDAPPRRHPSASDAGPTFDPLELAARKVLALYDRAEARDFTDVYALANRFGTDALIELAKDTDPGFDSTVFGQMLGTLSRFDDANLPTGSNPADLRRFFATWAEQLNG